MEQTNCEELEELEGIEAIVKLVDVISNDDVTMDEEEFVSTTDDALRDDVVILLDDDVIEEEVELVLTTECALRGDNVILLDDNFIDEEGPVSTTDDDLTDDDVVMLTGVEVILILEDDVFAVQTEKIRYRISRKIPSFWFEILEIFRVKWRYLEFIGRSKNVCEGGARLGKKTTKWKWNFFANETVISCFNRF